MRKGILTCGVALLVVCFAHVARADTFQTVIINNASFGNGPIQSWVLDLTTGTATSGGSFVPTGAMTGGPNGNSANGRAIAVTNTQFYYTELSGNGFGPTLNIETGLYNGGAGGPDNGTIANPLPGKGIQDLHFGSGLLGGDLFALAGYPNQGPVAFVFDPSNGSIVVPPVTIATDPGADGFTILPNGNYLINRGDAQNSYDQYNPLTGARIAGTNIVAPSCGGSTGVDTDGTFLYFDCSLNSVEQTDLLGNAIHHYVLPGVFGSGEGLSLIQNFNPPPPNTGTPEPTTLVLLGTGLATVIRRRFSKR